VILNQNQYIGGLEQFLEWALQTFRYTDKTNDIIYKRQAFDATKKAFNETPGRSYVYMNFNTGASLASQVIFELFDDVCPKTCENFRALCKGISLGPGRPIISYQGTECHRVVKGMYV